ncbi:auxin response factor 16-like [Bidens hawaiensis]|uniref:auxin response factor 16-like n=1 Tax=Bidens hawaiensis TaxID=980011 RepID=UPI0040490FD4
MNQEEKRVDPGLWHACAVDTIHMPLPDSYAYYLPQGHVEHTQTNVDFGDTPRVSYFLCKVIDVKFMADLELEEVYAKIMLSPQDANSINPDMLEDTQAVPEFQYYAKSLNESDIKNLYVPPACAEMFPTMVYSKTSHSQTVSATDIHGEIWKFRHVHYATPSKHTLTSGWHDFAKKKNLIKGNLVVFARAENGDLGVGFRREFVVKASCVNNSRLDMWNAEMRVKNFKIEGSSQTGSLTGTVSSVGGADPSLWPDSPWRGLQVNWDEERDELQNINRVSPWLVESVDIPEIHFKPTDQLVLKLFPEQTDGSQPRSIQLFGQQIHSGQHSSGDKGKEIDGMASSGDCEVFLESETVRRGTLDLSVTGSYEEVEKNLANLLGVKRSGYSTSVTYDDSAGGAVKRMGKEVFR